MGNPRFLGNIAGALLIFILITALYLTLANSQKNIPEVPISDLAKSIVAGEVKNILVEGGDLTITYQDDTVKKAKKEVETSLSQTMFNYGVSPEILAKTTIEIKNQGGFGYWLGNILPFLLPILFIVVFFWYLSRQVRGAGMKAFTFGQSRARITDPSDQDNKVTFKEVAEIGRASCRERV